MSKDDPKKPGVDADAIRELSALLNETGLTEIEIEHNGARLRVSRAAVNAVAPVAPVAATAPAATAPAAPSAGPAPGTVPSPMVGTVYLASEPGKPAFISVGKTVKAGDTLATLEDRELALERLKWATERQQHAFEYDKALASRQPATINVIRSEIEQADAQIAMIDEQIARTRLTAPFDGVVVSGDLSQRIGGAVSRGETLFEIAPPAK